MTPPHQREKEILEKITKVVKSDGYQTWHTANLEEIAKYIYSLESRLDDLQRTVENQHELNHEDLEGHAMLACNALIDEIKEDLRTILRKTEYSEDINYCRAIQDLFDILDSKRK